MWPQAKTFRATNTSGPVESAKVLADFGRFNLGEIWDSYGKFDRKAATPKDEALAKAGTYDHTRDEDLYLVNLVLRRHVA